MFNCKCCDKKVPQESMSELDEVAVLGYFDETTPDWFCSNDCLVKFVNAEAMKMFVLSPENNLEYSPRDEGEMF